MKSCLYKQGQSGELVLHSSCGLKVLFDVKVLKQWGKNCSGWRSTGKTVFSKARTCEFKFWVLNPIYRVEFEEEKQL